MRGLGGLGLIGFLAAFGIYMMLASGGAGGGKVSIPLAFGNPAGGEIDEWVDTVVEGKEKHEAIRTADVIRDVYFVLVKSGPMNQTQMVDKLSCNHGERIIKRVLKSQVDNTWEVSKGDHNALIYTHIAGAKLPTPKAEKWGVK